MGVVLTLLRRVVKLLSDGVPRFKQEILSALKVENAKSINLTEYWKRGWVSRSEVSFPVLRGGRQYAYSCVENAGKVVKRRASDGRLLVCRFILYSGDVKKGPTVRDLILKVMRESEVALFPHEVHRRICSLLGRSVSLKAVKNRLYDLYRAGVLSRLDRARGWQFREGFLYGLNYEAIRKRLAIFEGPLSVWSDAERRLIKAVENNVVSAKKIRDEMGLDESLITWLSRKLGREAPYDLKKIGGRKTFRIELVRNENKQLRGKGLIPWLKWIYIYGNLYLYDDRLPWDEVKAKLEREAFWLSDEGRKRVMRGEAFEKFLEYTYNLIDKAGEWKLKVVDVKRRWIGSSRKEFDRIYEVIIGPPELNINVKLVFEAKSGVLQSSDIDDFIEKLVAEYTFKDHQTGGIRKDVIPIIVVGKTADKKALEKARKHGIKIVFRTQLEDVASRLLGERITFAKYMKTMKKTIS